MTLERAKRWVASESANRDRARTPAPRPREDQHQHTQRSRRRLRGGSESDSRIHLERWVRQLAERLRRVERLDTRGRQLEASALVQADRVLVDPPALPNVRVI